MTKMNKIELAMLGQNIRRIRKARNLNQTALAMKASTRTATISEIENGVNQNPGWDLLERVATVLNTSIHQLTQPDAEFVSDTEKSPECFFTVAAEFVVQKLRKALF